MCWIFQFDQSGIVLAREQYINKTTKDDKVGLYLLTTYMTEKFKLFKHQHLNATSKLKLDWPFSRQTFVNEN